MGIDEREFQYILDAVNLITPPNWNIYAKPENRILKPGVLRIRLWICPEDDEEENEWVGRAEMARYTRVTPLHPALPSGASSQDVAFANVTIEIREFDLFVLIHELAHVVADRFLAWRQNVYRKEGFSLTAIPPDEGQHGTLFQRAYRILISRAKRYLNEEELKRNEADLDMYEKGEHPSGEPWR